MVRVHVAPTNDKPNAFSFILWSWNFVTIEPCCMTPNPRHIPEHIPTFIPLFIFHSPPHVFTPVHNQIVPCPVPPCDPSTMRLVCCCTGPTRSGRSERWERAGTAREGPRSTGRFPARGARGGAAAPWSPWGTQPEQWRRDCNPQPSSLGRSSRKSGSVSEVEIVPCASYILFVRRCEERRNPAGSFRLESVDCCFF